MSKIDFGEKFESLKSKFKRKETDNEDENDETEGKQYSEIKSFKENYTTSKNTVINRYKSTKRFHKSTKNILKEFSKDFSENITNDITDEEIDMMFINKSAHKGFINDNSLLNNGSNITNAIRASTKAIKVITNTSNKNTTDAIKISTETLARMSQKATESTLERISDIVHFQNSNTLAFYNDISSRLLSIDNSLKHMNNVNDLHYDFDYNRLSDFEKMSIEEAGYSNIKKPLFYLETLLGRGENLKNDFYLNLAKEKIQKNPIFKMFEGEYQVFKNDPKEYLLNAIMGEMFDDEIGFGGRGFGKVRKKSSKPFLDQTIIQMLSNVDINKLNLDNHKFLKFFNNKLGINPFKALDLFKVNMNSKVEKDFSNYQKGRVYFDGETKRAITYEIPTLLQKILKGVSGEDITYDNKTGQFINTSSIKEKYKLEEENELKEYFKNIDSRFKSMSSFESSKDKNKLEKDYKKFLEMVKKDGIDINKTYRTGNSELDEIINDQSFKIQLVTEAGRYRSAANEIQRRRNEDETYQKVFSDYEGSYASDYRKEISSKNKKQLKENKEIADFFDKVSSKNKYAGKVLNKLFGNYLMEAKENLSDEMDFSSLDEIEQILPSGIEKPEEITKGLFKKFKNKSNLKKYERIKNREDLYNDKNRNLIIEDVSEILLDREEDYSTSDASSKKSLITSSKTIPEMIVDFDREKPTHVIVDNYNNSSVITSKIEDNDEEERNSVREKAEKNRKENKEKAEGMKERNEEEHDEEELKDAIKKSGQNNSGIVEQNSILDNLFNFYNDNGGMSGVKSFLSGTWKSFKDGGGIKRLLSTKIEDNDEEERNSVREKAEKNRKENKEKAEGMKERNEEEHDEEELKDAIKKSGQNNSGIVEQNSILDNLFNFYNDNGGMSGVKSFLSGTWKSFKDGGGIKRLLSTIKSKGVVGNLNSIGNGLNKFSNILKGNPLDTVGKFSNLGNSLSTVANSSKFGGLLSKLGSLVPAGGLGSLGTLGSTISGGLGSLGTAASGALGTLGSTIGGGLGSLGTAAGGALGTLGSTIGGGLGSLGTLGSTIGGGLGSLGTLGSTIGGGLGSLGTAASGALTAVAPYLLPAAAAGLAGYGIYKGGKWLWNNKDKVIEGAKNVGGKVIGGVKKIGSTLWNGVTNIGDGISNLFNKDDKTLNPAHLGLKSGFLISNKLNSMMNSDSPEKNRIQLKTVSSENDIEQLKTVSSLELASSSKGSSIPKPENPITANNAIKEKMTPVWIMGSNIDLMSNSIIQTNNRNKNEKNNTENLNKILEAFDTISSKLDSITEINKASLASLLLNGGTSSNGSSLSGSSNYSSGSTSGDALMRVFNDTWKYEMGGAGPGTVAGSLNDGAGKNYGVASMTQKYNMTDFMKFLKNNYPNLASKLSGNVGSSEFDSSWKKLGETDEQEFLNAQVQYTMQSKLEPALEKIKSKTGVDLNNGKYSEGVFSLLLSTSNQRPAWVTEKWIPYLKENPNASSEEIIQAIGGDISTNYSGVYASSIKNRYAKQTKNSLSMTNTFTYSRNASLGNSSSTSSSATVSSSTSGNYSIIGDSNVGGTSTDSSKTQIQNALVDKMLSVKGKLQYSQSGPRDPEQGSADCSSTVAWAYKKVLGVDIGGYTGAQIKSDLFTTIDSSNDGKAHNISSLEPGDLLFFKSSSNNGRYRNVGHVEMYMGNGEMIGHGSGTGPKISKLANRTNYLEARRLKQFGGYSVNSSNASSAGSYLTGTIGNYDLGNAISKIFGSNDISTNNDYYIEGMKLVGFNGNNSSSTNTSSSSSSTSSSSVSSSSSFNSSVGSSSIITDNNVNSTNNSITNVNNGSSISTENNINNGSKESLIEKINNVINKNDYIIKDTNNINNNEKINSNIIKEKTTTSSNVVSSGNGAFMTIDYTAYLETIAKSLGNIDDNTDKTNSILEDILEKIEKFTNSTSVHSSNGGNIFSNSLQREVQLIAEGI